LTIDRENQSISCKHIFYISPITLAATIWGNSWKTWQWFNIYFY